MTKLESYMLDGSFSATQFYADIEGHPDDPAVKLAMEELDYFTSSVTVLGVYPAAAARGWSWSAPCAGAARRPIRFREAGADMRLANPVRSGRKQP